MSTKYKTWCETTNQLKFPSSLPLLVTKHCPGYRNTVLTLTLFRCLKTSKTKKGQSKGGNYITELKHCVKSSQIRSFFRSVFSRIRTEYRKIRTRKNSVFGHFLYSEADTLTNVSWNIFSTLPFSFIQYQSGNDTIKEA